ncbi:MAG: RNA ligase family protein [Planctomycetes bacterium]|nr:RNA ligase family protein [Planctomycetota bacterium]
MVPIRKYPRTPHIQGSRFQPGDEDLAAVPFEALAGRHLVVEEKLDGANTGIRFDATGQLLLQSRGHYLTGGPREKRFDLFKRWAHSLAERLRPVLGQRHVLYGEWLYAKHTVFYDQLPHYFLEFDVLDLETDEFLPTERRRGLLSGLPIVSVPVLLRGEVATFEDLAKLVGPSLYKSSRWRERLIDACTELGLDPEQVLAETDGSDLMEGLYIKAEEEDCVVGRYKYVRTAFRSGVVEPEGAWLRRPLVPNGLRDGVNLFRGAA